MAVEKMVFKNVLGTNEHWGKCAFGRKWALGHMETRGVITEFYVLPSDFSR